MDKQRELAGHVAVVTGASGGIGSAIATALAARGADVVVHYHKGASAAQAVAVACRDWDVQAITVGADLTTATGAQTLLTAARTLGSPRVFVNNAGQSLTKLFVDTSPTEFQAILDANLTSTFLCTRLALSGMIAQGYGRIVNVSSVWGITGGACETAYSAAKGAVISLTKALAKEVANTGITVNAVAPGAIDTSMLDDLSPEDAAVLRAEIPLGRLGRPSEVAHAVCMLASPDASYLTGQVVSPNGGWFM